MYDYVIAGQAFQRVCINRDFGIAKAVLSGLTSNGYTALLFSDKIGKDTAYRVVVRKLNDVEFE